MGHIPLIWEYVAQCILDISSVNIQDWVNITANYLALLRGDKDPIKKAINRGYSDAAIKYLRSQQKFDELKVNGLRFTRPLTDFEYPLIGYILTLLEQHEKGNLPFPGSASEQPAQIIEIFNILGSVRYEFQKSRDEQAQQQARLKQRAARK